MPQAAQLPVYAGDAIVAHALVDAADLAALERLRWRLRRRSTGDVVAWTRLAGQTILLHHAIVQPDPGAHVTFRNGHTLDCRRQNLVLAKGRPRPHRGTQGTLALVDDAPALQLALCGDTGQVEGHALIDLADIDLVRRLRWKKISAPDGMTYAYTRVRRDGRDCVVLLHRAITGAAAGQAVRHRNGDGLDCRRANLVLD